MKCAILLAMDKAAGKFVKYADITWNTIMEESCILPSLLVRAYFDGNLEEVVQKIAEENSKWQISKPSNTSPKTN